MSSIVRNARLKGPKIKTIEEILLVGYVYRDEDENDVIVKVSAIASSNPALEPQCDRGSTSKDNGPKGNPGGKQVTRIQSTPKISRDDVGLEDIMTSHLT